CRVAPDVSRTEVPALEHRDVLDAVPRCEIVGGGEPVSPAPDNDHIVAATGLGLAPGAPPFRTQERAPCQGECGVMAKFGHGSLPVPEVACSVAPAHGYSWLSIVAAQLLILDAKIYGAVKKNFGDGHVPILA